MKKAAFRLAFDASNFVIVLLVLGLYEICLRGCLDKVLPHINNIAFQITLSLAAVHSHTIS